MLHYYFLLANAVNKSCFLLFPETRFLITFPVPRLFFLPAPLANLTFLLRPLLLTPIVELTRRRLGVSLLVRLLLLPPVIVFTFLSNFSVNSSPRSEARRFNDSSTPRFLTITSLATLTPLFKRLFPIAFPALKA